MRSGDHDADASLALGYGGEAEGHGKDAVLEQLLGELFGQGRLAEHQRGDGRDAAADVKAEPLELCFEVARVRPQPVDQLGR